jgi:hypothetical protein
VNLQAKRSVYRSRKSQQKLHATSADLPTVFMGQLLASKNRRRAAKAARQAARERARPQRRGGARITSSRDAEMSLASAMLFGVLSRMHAAKGKKTSAGESVK